MPKDTLAWKCRSESFAFSHALLDFRVVHRSSSVVIRIALRQFMQGTFRLRNMYPGGAMQLSQRNLPNTKYYAIAANGSVCMICLLYTSDAADE